jgi:hypothetical protein
MIDISLAGLIGAIIGTAIAGVVYYLCVGAVQRSIAKRSLLESAEDRDRFFRNMSAVRRAILAVDLIVFAGLGYLVGSAVWD